jgi:transcriptional regulator
MYIPKQFAEENLDRLHTLMRNYPFATLITWNEGHPLVTHIPFILDSERGDQGTLIGHLAKKNPHSRHIVDNKEALVIFQGPHAYVSPAWYAGEHNVPTWNYTAVHTFGSLKTVENPDAVRAILDNQTACYEAELPEPWEIPWGDERNHHMLHGLIAFELTIERLEGKFKLNQNKTEADRRQVIETLQASARCDDHEVALMMQENGVVG